MQGPTTGIGTTQSDVGNVNHEPKVVPVGDSPSTPIVIKVSPTNENGLCYGTNHALKELVLIGEQSYLSMFQLTNAYMLDLKKIGRDYEWLKQAVAKSE